MPKNLYPGQDKHRGNPLFLEEVKKTMQNPRWKEELLSRVNNFLRSYTGKIRQVGSRINEVQLRYDFPIASFFSFQPLKAAWIQFNVWEPFSKKDGTRVLRFSEPTGCLMMLIRSPKESGDWNWYLLARKKYQFGVGSHIVEFTRGWVTRNKPNEMGWALMDRDYPGLRDANFVAGIFHTMLGNEVWENTAEFTNKTSYHVVVVTLAKSMTKEELKNLLVREKLKREYEGVQGYANLGRLDETDLVSEPMVFELVKAAEYLNAHLTGKTVKPFFGEAYSLACWSRFLAVCGKRFSYLMPNTCELPE